MISISIIVSGKVQGVWYRQSTREMALILGITGEVRNLADGRVYIVATGSKEQLEKLVGWSKQGSEKARVTGIEIQDISFQQFDGFAIIRR
jgi:acylphosphatase